MAVIVASGAALAAEIAGLIGVVELGGAVGLTIETATGSALLASGVETGIISGATFGINQILIGAIGRENYDLLQQKEGTIEDKFIQYITMTHKDRDKYIDLWGQELYDKIIAEQERQRVDIQAGIDFGNAGSNESMKIADFTIHHISDKFIDTFQSSRSTTINDRVEQLEKVTTVGKFMASFVSERSKKFLENIQGPVFQKYLNKYIEIFEYKYLTCEIEFDGITPDTLLPVRRWYYSRPDKGRILLWDTSFNLKGRHILPSLYGTYVGKDSRNDSAPFKPSGYDPDVVMSSIDIICAIHDLNYHYYGFSQHSDLILLAMITNNYEFFNETEKRVSRIATNYFFSLGKLVSKNDLDLFKEGSMFETNRDFREITEATEINPLEKIYGVPLPDSVNTCFRDDTARELQRREREVLINELYEEMGEEFN